MANKINITFVDDITGEEIPPGDHTKMTLGFQGADYELDVAQATLDDVSAYIRTLVANVKPVKRRGRKPSTSAAAQPSTEPVAQNGKVHRDTGKIREWARENGYKVKERGRIHADIIAAYDTAMSGS